MANFAPIRGSRPTIHNPSGVFTCQVARDRSQMLLSVYNDPINLWLLLLKKITCAHVLCWTSFLLYWLDFLTGDAGVFFLCPWVLIYVDACSCMLRQCRAPCEDLAAGERARGQSSPAKLASDPGRSEPAGQLPIPDYLQATRRT